FYATVAFSQPELLSLGRETLEGFIAQEARLSHLSMYVDNLFRSQEHVRDGAIEQVMGLANDPLEAIDNVYETLTGQDMVFRPAVGADGKEYTVAQATIDTLYGNADREVRRSAYESYTDGYLALK